MGSVRLYPNLISSLESQGTWQNEAASSTSADICASLSDASTATYVTMVTNPFSKVIRFDDLSPGDIPSDARITGVACAVQGKTFLPSTGSYFGGYVRMGTQASPGSRNNTNPFFYRWIDYRSYPSHQITLKTNSKGEQITEDIINNIDIRVFSTGKTGTYPNAWIQTKMRITSLYIDALFDEKPVTDNITVTSIADTPRPTVNWDYTDDIYTEQQGFQVKIVRVSNGVTAYDSGYVQGDVRSHELTKNLVIGIAYYASVRTSQPWNSPGGTFWSDWKDSSNFTITVTPPPRAGITVAQVQGSGYNLVTLSMSGWAGDFTDGSTYVAIQGLDLDPSIPNLTPAQWAALSGTDPVLYASMTAAAAAKFLAGFGVDNKWKFIEAKVVPNGATSVAFHDHTVKSGVVRIYRTYTYKWNSTYGFLLTNQLVQDTYTGYAPQTVTFKGAWMSAIEPATDPITGAVVEFAYDSYNFRLANSDSDSSETHGKDITTFNTSGYTFPTADFSNDEMRSVEVKVKLLNDGADELALRKLNARKCPIDYRDQRGQRIRGIISSMKFQNTIWGKEASFTVTAVGEQFEDNNLG